MRVAGGAIDSLVDGQGYGRHSDDSAHQPIDALKFENRISAVGQKLVL